MGASSVVTASATAGPALIVTVCDEVTSVAVFRGHAVLARSFKKC